MLRLPLLLSLALAGVLTAELWWPPGGSPPPAPPPRTQVSPVAAPGPTAARPSDPVPVLLARPLFTPGRRPPRVAPAAAEAAPVSLPRLAGVLVDGASRRAILVPAPGGKPVVAAEGVQVGAFAVERIEPGQVTLVGPGGTRVLRPSFAPPAPAAKPAAGPISGAPGPAGLPSLPAGPIPGIAGLLPPPATPR